MKSQLPFTVKAYTATNALLISKPMFLDMEHEIINLWADMHALGVSVYFIKQGRESKRYLLPQNTTARFTSVIPVKK